MIKKELFNSIVIIICCCIILSIIFLNYKTFMFDNHGDLISIIVSACSIRDRYLKCNQTKEEGLAEKLLLYRIKTGKIEDFFDLISKIDEDINKLEERKAEKQKQIGDKLEKS